MISPQDPIPDLEEIKLHVDIGSQTFTFANWESYTFSAHMLTPYSAWSMSVTDDRIGEAIGDKLSPGLKCTLSCNNRTLATGRIDRVDTLSSRGSGTEWHVTGRDLMAQCLDSGLNPMTNQFKADQTLEHIAEKVFSPFGFHVFAEDNSANRAYAQGQVRGFKVSKVSGNILKKYRLNEQLKPHRNEGAYEFVERIAKRFGLHVWLSVDGTTVIIGKPNFEQKPSYSLIHRKAQSDSQDNNVLSSDVVRDATDQPSYIVATGYGGGGVGYRGSMKVLLFNELVCLNPDGTYAVDVSQIKKEHLGSHVLPFRDRHLFRPESYMPLSTARPLFLHDDESREPTQLINFAKREMAHRQRKVLTATYEVAGHTQHGVSWHVDTMVNVDDDVSNIHEPMYVHALTYSNSRHSGKRTKLELIRPHTLAF